LLKQISKNLANKGETDRSSGFTLVEVIVSIAVLVFVITSATGILTTVMRSNTDNLSSLLAYGLAQEGVEAMRNIRDSNFVLGLDFAGKKPGSFDVSAWGANLFEENSEEAKLFVLHKSTQLTDTCTKSNFAECLPFQLEEVGSGEITEDLISNSSTQIFKMAETEDSLAGFDLYVQRNELNANALPFHRIIRVQPLKNKLQEVDTLRVSSMVFYPSASGEVERKVVLTTDLTNWKK
jgi:prepilin-type N-terminal cleavage/methylation domain-containing protein